MAVTVPASGSWRRLVAQLEGAKLAEGPWYAPRLAFFAMAAESPQTRIDIDNLSLIGPDGDDIVANRHFAQGMSHWFTTSDRYHLPWHIKNLGLNVLFDQGVVGLLLFVILTGSAMYRLIAGAARGHPFAPFLAAALAGEAPSTLSHTGAASILNTLSRVARRGEIRLSSEISYRPGGGCSTAFWAHGVKSITSRTYSRLCNSYKIPCLVAMY